MPEDNPNSQGFFGGLWNTVSGFFEAGFSKVWNSFSDVWWKIISESSERTSKLLQGAEDKLWLPYVNALVKRKWIDEDTANDLRSLTALNFPYNIFAFMIVSLGVMLSVVKQLVYTAGADAKRILFTKYHPEDIKGESIIPLGFVEPDKIPQIKQILLQNGYPPEQIDLLFLAMQRIYDEGTIRTLYFRKVLSEEQTYERMRNLGYTDDRIVEIIQSWPFIPPVGDMLAMAIREAFSPEIIEYYGYAQEFPTAQLDYLKAQGLSEDLAKRYWYAHWILPSTQMAFDMLHRGIIDMKELNDLLRIADIAPYWRDKLTAIAYTPFTRVDIRRMHSLKILTDEELISSYMDIGYDEDKAVKMAEFTKALNGEERTNLTKAEIIKGYGERFITKENAVSMLSDLKFNAEEIDFYLVLEDYKYEKEIQSKNVKIVQTLFTNNLIEEFDARTKLTTLNLRGEQIDVLMQGWLLERIVDIKQPTKSELDRFVKKNIITPDEYITELSKLGYSNNYIAWYLADFQTPLPKAK